MPGGSDGRLLLQSPGWAASPSGLLTARASTIIRGPVSLGSLPHTPEPLLCGLCLFRVQGKLGYGYDWHIAVTSDGGLWGHPLHKRLQFPRVTCSPGRPISISGSVGPASTEHRPRGHLSNVFLEHPTRLVALLSQSPTLKEVPQLLSGLFTPGRYLPHSFPCTWPPPPQTWKPLAFCQVSALLSQLQLQH